jgi:hypothetical protein
MADEPRSGAECEGNLQQNNLDCFGGGFRLPDDNVAGDFPGHVFLHLSDDGVFWEGARALFGVWEGTGRVNGQARWPSPPTRLQTELKLKFL